MNPAPESEDLALLEHFTRRLEQLGTARPLHELVAGGGFASASYRLSLLALLADGGEGGEGGPAAGPVGAFMRLPLAVEFEDRLCAVGDDEIAAMTHGTVGPRRNASESA